MPVAAKLVTVITTYGAREDVESKLLELGARGTTVTPVEGRGHHGRRPRTALEGKNMEISVVVTVAVANAILAWVESDLAPHVPSIAYSVDATAVPTDHFA